MAIMRSTSLPVGIWVDSGIAVNLESEQAAQFIRACAHMLDLQEGKTSYNDIDVKDVHPGIRKFLDDLKNK